MDSELIVIIIIVAVLGPLMYMNTRKNKARNSNRRERGFMSDYLDEKRRNKKKD
jgi:formate hydrogenlyase subunit 4